MTSHPENETRPVYRLSESVPGDEPVKEPVFPCEARHKDYSCWLQLYGGLPVETYLAMGWTRWRPSQPEQPFGQGAHFFDPSCECKTCGEERARLHEKHIGSLSSSSPVTQSAKPDERALACAREIVGYINPKWDPFYIEVAKKRITDNAAIIAKHYAPASSTPEGLTQRVELTGTKLALKAEQAVTARLKELLMSANKWLRMIDERRDEVPGWFRHDADPRPLRKEIEGWIKEPFIPASTTEGRK